MLLTHCYSGEQNPAVVASSPAEQRSRGGRNHSNTSHLQENAVAVAISNAESDGAYVAER